MLTPAQIEETAIKLVLHWLNNMTNIEAELGTKEEATAIYDRINEIMLGAPFRVKIESGKVHGVWGTNG